MRPDHWVVAGWSGGGRTRQQTAIPAAPSAPVALRTWQLLPLATDHEMTEPWEMALQSVRVQPEGQDTWSCNTTSSNTGKRPEGEKFRMWSSKMFLSVENVYLIFISWCVFQQVALQRWSVAAHGMRWHPPVFYNTALPMPVMGARARRDLSSGPRRTA